MCGLVGVWWPGGQREAEARTIVTTMASAIHHRGPDAAGVWTDARSGIAIGHRRLSILDVSDAGAQPMTSASGRYVIAYNGEVYNHLELRQRLEAEGRVQMWRGHSDTETILAAVEAWGFEQALTRLFGMFAIALWDSKRGMLSLARDRMGEKPLYYGTAGNKFVFGSELKALLAAPGFKADIDPGSVAAYLRYLYVPDPMSVFRGIGKVPAGHWIDVAAGVASEPRPYWSLETVIANGQTAHRDRDYEALCEQLEACLSSVVHAQMLSDVPIGSFLSGGVDSSLITALMQAGSRKSIKTFSIGFEDERFNEAPHARRVAEHLGTNHTEFIVTEADALALVPDLSSIYDEPFADPSKIPTILLSRLARRDVTVALTGDGGDELFGGYNRYTIAPWAWGQLSVLPTYGRSLVGGAAALLARWISPEDGRQQALARRMGLPISTLDRLARLGGSITRSQTLAELYRELTSVSHSPADYLRETTYEQISHRPMAKPLEQLSPAEWMMLKDAQTYLPGDILVKVDRAAMSASLETRAPFLDPRVVEVAWQLPLSAKIHGRLGKRILRDLLYRHVPKPLIERPKQGFDIPLDRWLRGELRDWAGDLLSPSLIERYGIFDAAAVAKLWDGHQQLRDNAGKQLWSILMMQLWKGTLDKASAAHLEHRVSA